MGTWADGSGPGSLGEGHSPQQSGSMIYGMGLHGNMDERLLDLYFVS